MNSILSARERSLRRTPAKTKKEIVIPSITSNLESSNNELPKFLRDSRMMQVKNFNHHFILEFGQEMWQQIEKRNEESMKRKVKIIKEKLKRQMEEKKEEIIANYKTEAKRENEEMKRRIENEANIKRQIQISKLTDDLLLKNDLALKDQKEKMVQLMKRSIQKQNADWEKKCEELILEARSEELDKHNIIMRNEKKQFEMQQSDLIEAAEKKKKKELSDLYLSMTDKINEEVKKTYSIWEGKCQREISSLKSKFNDQLQSLEKQLDNTQILLKETQKQLDTSIAETEQLKVYLMDLNGKYEFFINNSINVNTNNQCFLVPTPKPVLDILAEQMETVNIQNK